MDYLLCEVCGKNQTELHHIIFRSQASYMCNIKVNFKFLCPEHHRGNTGPHLNRKIDTEYKIKLQKKLFELFSEKEFWTEKEIRLKLNCSKNEIRNITKKMLIQKEGYRKLDVVIRLMGGRIYAT